MMTNESFFFRDKTAVRAFPRGHHAGAARRARDARRRIRIWCAAASTGQEPYSLAMALKEMGEAMAGWRIEIVATDLSTEVLEKAKSRHLQPVRGAARAADPTAAEIFHAGRRKPGRSRPRFAPWCSYRPLNLLNDFSPLGQFDVVFCRNVLIYFDQATKIDVLDRIARNTERDGYLLLGAAETVVGLSDSFRPLPDRRGLYAPNAAARAPVAMPRRRGSRWSAADGSLANRRVIPRARRSRESDGCCERLELSAAAAYRRSPPAARIPNRIEDCRSMKVAQAISRALVSEGVTLAAGIAGQSIWPVIDAIGDCEEISLMYARQERVAFDICDGFARAGGKPAVVFTDAGPAAANLMGGIVNSWGDSVPVLFLAGHNERTKIAAKYTKELPFLDVFGPVSKWSAMIDDPAKVARGAAPRLHAYAHRTARAGGARPAGRRLPDGGRQFRIHAGLDLAARAQRRRSRRDRAARSTLIADAERPYVYVGAGVLFSEATRGARALCRNAVAAGRDHAQRQERVSGKPSARARHRRLRPRLLRLAAGDDAGGECRRHPHHRLRLQAARHHRAAERAHQAHPDRRRSGRDQPRSCRRRRHPRRRQGGAAAIVRRRRRACRRRGRSRSRGARRRSRSCAGAGPRCASRCSIPRTRRSIRSA